APNACAGRSPQRSPPTSLNTLFPLIFRASTGTIRRIMYEQHLRAALPQVQERIARAAERSAFGQDVRIIAVTKGHPVAAVRAAIAAGLYDCGENRVAE